jgi:hypothetical protein
MEKIIIMIQKKFLQKKFVKELKKNIKNFDVLNFYTIEPQYINLLDPVKQKDNLFCELRKKLLSKQLINEISILLDSYYRYYGFDNKIAPKINSKKLLVSWMIISFPEFILSIKNPRNEKNKNGDIYPYDIFWISNDFLENLNSLLINKITNENLRKFNKSFNKYSNAINYFLQRDKNEQIQSLLTEFINLNKTIKDIENSEKYPNEESKNDSIKMITDTKLKIAKYLKKLDSDITLDDLEIQSKLHDEIEKNMEKALCDILLKDIKNKKFSYLSNFIDETTKKMIDLGAHKIDNQFEKKIDKDIIIKKIAFLEIEYQDIIQYGDYMIHIINNLQAPDSIYDTQYEWENIKSNYTEKNELLCNMLIFILKEIKEIYYAIQDTKIAFDLGLNVFN